VEIVHQPKLAFCSKGENQDSRRRHPSLGQMQRICMPIATDLQIRGESAFLQVLKASLQAIRLQIFSTEETAEMRC